MDLPPGRAHVIVSYLPGAPSETASDEAVLEVLDALAAVELDDELVFPLTGAVSVIRQGGDPAKFLAWFHRRCADHHKA
jgi:hypothetical protein